MQFFRCNTQKQRLLRRPAQLRQQRLCLGLFMSSGGIGLHIRAAALAGFQPTFRGQAFINMQNGILIHSQFTSEFAVTGPWLLREPGGWRGWGLWGIILGMEKMVQNLRDHERINSHFMAQKLWLLASHLRREYLTRGYVSGSGAGGHTDFIDRHSGWMLQCAGPNGLCATDGARTIGRRGAKKPSGLSAAMGPAVFCTSELAWPSLEYDWPDKRHLRPRHANNLCFRIWHAAV